MSYVTLIKSKELVDFVEKSGGNYPARLNLVPVGAEHMRERHPCFWRRRISPGRCCEFWDCFLTISKNLGGSDALMHVARVQARCYLDRCWDWADPRESQILICIMTSTRLIAFQTKTRPDENKPHWRPWYFMTCTLPLQLIVYIIWNLHGFVDVKSPPCFPVLPKNSQSTIFSCTLRSREYLVIIPQIHPSDGSNRFITTSAIVLHNGQSSPCGWTEGERDPEFESAQCANTTRTFVSWTSTTSACVSIDTKGAYRSLYRLRKPCQSDH